MMMILMMMMNDDDANDNIGDSDYLFSQFLSSVHLQIQGSSIRNFNFRKL